MLLTRGCALCLLLSVFIASAIRSPFQRLVFAHPLLDKRDLLPIKNFILARGTARTYCNRFNNNPHIQTDGFEFYLDPDSPLNVGCDPARSDFQTLTIRTRAIPASLTSASYISVSFESSDGVVWIDASASESSESDVIAELDAALLSIRARMQTAIAEPSPAIY